jgi:hypothetical protein
LHARCDKGGDAEVVTASTFGEATAFKAFVNSGSKFEVSVSDFKLGLKGGVISFFARASQSMSLKNGCLFNSSASSVAPSLCFGFRFKRHLTKFLPSELRVLFQNRILPKRIFLVNFPSIFSVEWTPAAAHFENENSQ